jgi:chromosome segregation ATPase
MTPVTFTIGAPVVPVKHSSGSVTTIHTEEASVVITAANMMMQRERAQRALTQERMKADAKASEALKSALDEIKQLTGIVTNLTAEVALLKEQLTQKNLVQTATIEEFQKQVTELAADVQTFKKNMPFIKQAVRHYYATVEKRRDAAGNLLDPLKQMIKPAVIIPPHAGYKKQQEEQRKLSELEQFIDWNNRESWQVGWKKPSFYDAFGQ